MQHEFAATSTYQFGERVARAEARIDASEATNVRLEEKIDKLLWLIIVTLLSAVGGLVTTIITALKHG